ncbi:phospholipase domain-containing protein [Streptomyces sp. NPDC056682]|uniref:phospholipase domain-containing protein n=1 Tax=Streptomyces sp. NPDC056682 TaxID=3345909 RepID=UPI0036D02B32
MPSARNARRASRRSTLGWAAVLVATAMTAGPVATGTAAAAQARSAHRSAARGPVPSVTSADDCAGGGVDVTASNTGDAPFGFALAGVAVTVGPGRSRTVTVPVAEHQSYDFTVLGPGGFHQDVTGVLTCAANSVAAGDGTTPSPPSPAPATGSDRGSGTLLIPVTPRGSPADPGDRRLAIAGITDLDSLFTGAVLVLLGVMVFVIRRLRIP